MEARGPTGLMLANSYNEEKEALAEY